MTIDFENYGQFAVTLHYGDLTNVNYESHNGYTLKECTDFIEHRMEDDYNCLTADIIDIHTGEVVAIVTNDPCEDLNEWDEPFDYFDEVGFNPYEGCYDFDC